MLHLLNVAYTQSSSEIEVYFNYPLTSVDAPNLLSTSSSAIEKRIVDMIEGAKESIDLAAYNLNNNAISAALKRASNRGIVVRVVTDIDTRHPDLLDADVNFQWLAVNDRGLMHHKFLVIDVASQSLAQVAMGAMNFTSTNIHFYYNDLLIFKNQTLAQAYTDEFELLWGSNREDPNSKYSRSGSDKPRRNPTEVEIGNVAVKLFFSPNDEYSTALGNVIRNAEKSIGLQLLLITYRQLTNELIAAKNRGVEVFGVVNDATAPSSQFNNLVSQGVDLWDNPSNKSIHHKYAVIDASMPSKAVIATGSHNWTYSAETYNDESAMLISGSPALAEIFYEAARTNYCAISKKTNCQVQLTNVDRIVKLPSACLRQSNDLLSLPLECIDNNVLSSYRIYNSLGQLIQAGVFTTHSQDYQVSLPHLNSGAYVIQFRSNYGWSASSKFLINH